MLRLDGVVRRRRTLVLALWGLLFLAALPFAAQQSDNLTGGGFTVPGSDSLAAEKELERDFPGYERSPLYAVVVPRRGASEAEVRAAQQRVARAVADDPRVSLAPGRV